MESFVGGVVNKLRSTVSSTVSGLNQALPGNPVTREYEVTGHICSAGPGLLWKVFAASKKSTKEEASVFLFEKKALEKYPKRDRELILEIMRKGVSQLTRLRHPSILTVQHPLEESRDSLAFATEPVAASLANLLGFQENLPHPVPPEIADHEFYDVEIKYGLLLVSEGLAFLHNDVKLLHRNLCPEVILISKKGAWKLSGFEFCVSPFDPHDMPLRFPLLNVVNQANDYPTVALPNFDYLAPEYISEASASDARLTLTSDMFSLGALTYALYNHGKALLPTGGSVSLLSSRRIEQMDKLPADIFNCIPEDSRFHVKLLLSTDATLRPDAHQFSQLNIFEDILVRTLQYLDALFQWDNLQKSQFYKGLPEIMARMPLRVKLNRVIPSLAKEYLNPDMVPFVLPNVLIVAEEVTNEEFTSMILPDLIPVFTMKEPIQISMILMQKMEIILSKSKSHPDSIKTHILPMMCRALEVDAQQVQELCLKTIPIVAYLIDYPSMKNAIIPRIKRLCLSANYLSVRVKCLICLGEILENLDKWLVLDEIIPFLPEIPSKEPAVIMASIGIIQRTMSSSKLGLTKEIMANKVVPFLMPLSIENGLTMNQFNTIMSLIKEVIKRVETEHSAKLEQLNSMKEAHSFAMVKYETTSSKQLVTSNSNSNSLNDMFNGSSSSTSRPSSVSPSTSTEKVTRNLTLQEKERLSREKEHNQTFKSQQPLVPQQPRREVSSHQPKDLTSSLITSNLANLALNSPKPASVTSNNTMLSTNRFPLIGSAISPGPAAMPQMTAFPATFQPMPQYYDQPQPQPQPQIRPAPAQHKGPSPFDNLVIPNLAKSQTSMNKQSINLMTTSTGWTPMMSPQPALGPVLQTSQSATANKLSKSDLEDFLS